MNLQSRQWLIAALTQQPLPVLEPLAEPVEARGDGELASTSSASVFIEASTLIAAAESEGVLALVVEALAKRPAGELPLNWLAAFQTAARHESLGQLAMLAEQRRVFAALTAANVPFLVLKGGALAHWLYPQPHLRIVTDLDLLLPSRDALQALETVLFDLGYCKAPEVGSRIGKEHPFSKPGGPYGQYTVDAHWALLNSPILANCFSFEPLHAESRVLPECCGARGLSPVDALLNAVGHRALNMPYTYVQGIQNARSLRWLWDIHLLLQHLTPEDWLQLNEKARGKGLCGILSAALQTAITELQSPVPAEYLCAWQVQARQEHVQLRWFSSWPRYQWQQFLASDGTWPGRFTWLGQRIWPNADAMRGRYGAIHEPGWRVLLRRCGVGVRRLFGKG